MSNAYSHLKKAVAVDENPSHAIELQAPHLVSNIPNKGRTNPRLKALATQLLRYLLVC